RAISPRSSSFSPSHQTSSSYSLSFFTDTATTELYSLSLHDALPILDWSDLPLEGQLVDYTLWPEVRKLFGHKFELVSGSLNLLADRKSTRLNSSHVKISYAVFCLKKKKFSGDM